MDVSPNSIEHLILEGAVEVAGMNLETGEMLYSFTPQLADINPRLFEEVSNYVYGAVFALWQKGFIDMDIISSDEPLIRSNEKSFDTEAIKEELGDREQQVLEQVLRALDGKSQV